MADLVVRFLQMWGFVGGQILWMVAPFLGEDLAEGSIASMARALEDPQTLDALHTPVHRAVDITRGASE
ncbi:MAG: hypothetical protein JXC32_01530 [Anaerolineae bacterium]|nr:hypothetical protein [Anaerolineae bacterium]